MIEKCAHKKYEKLLSKQGIILHFYKFKLVKFYLNLSFQSLLNLKSLYDSHAVIFYSNMSNPTFCEVKMNMN